MHRLWGGLQCQRCCIGNWLVSSTHAILARAKNLLTRLTIRTHRIPPPLRQLFLESSYSCSKKSFQVSLATTSKLKFTANCWCVVFRGRSTDWKDRRSQLLRRSRFKKKSSPGLRYGQLRRRLYRSNSVSTHRPIPEFLFETLSQYKLSQTSQHYVAFAPTESMLFRLHDRSCYCSKYSSGLATLTGLNYQGSLSSLTESVNYPG